MNKTSYKKKKSSINSNCGVFGAYNHPKAAILTCFGLHSLQHRGQESSGIVTSEYLPGKNKYKFNIHKDFGLVLNIFSNEKIFTDILIGNSAIGHNRYSTTGSSDIRNNIQPFKVVYKYGNLALSHNGNLTNVNTLREKLQEDGTIFQTTTDSELILHLIAKIHKQNIVDTLKEVFSMVQGAYSICILTDDKLIAVRDPLGVRPLSLGKMDDAYFFASETSAFDINNIDYVRDIDPGEIVVIDKEVVKTGKVKSYHYSKSGQYAHCIFEYIYFARPDSMVFGEKVDKIRRFMGKNLAIESPPPDKDNPKDEDEKKVIVMNVPDSSNTATIGYISEVRKHTTNVKHEIGLIRSHYIGRTFIQPGHDNREMKIRTKFSIIKGIIEDRKIVIIDDSIVRGSTLTQLVKLIKRAKPKEIHLRITSPPIISPCYYGMDFPSKKELIANNHKGNIKAIQKDLGVDSLKYLSVDMLLESVPFTNLQTGYCTACFTKKYPIPISDIEGKNKNSYD